jgi:hypothetical protein
MAQLNVSGDCIARQEGASEIQWGDETGLRSDDVRGLGYAPMVQTPMVLANAAR